MFYLLWTEWSWDNASLLGYTGGPQFPGKMGTQGPLFLSNWGPGSPYSRENGDLGSPFSQDTGMNQALTPLCQQYHAYSAFQRRLEQAREPRTVHTRCLLSLATLYSHKGGRSYAPERPHPVYSAQYVQNAVPSNAHVFIANAHMCICAGTNQRYSPVIL